MSGVGAKLSRHVLGMKFMRKTKDQIDRSDKVNVTSTGSSTSVKAESSINVKNEPTATSPTLVVEELWSYNQCERYIFGRQSFGGFNPSVEKNLKKGIWKPFYLDGGANLMDSSDDEDIKKLQSDVDVSDEEMAKTFGSLVGTLAKRFKGNRKDKGNKGKIFKGKANDDRKPKWKKRFQKKSNEQEDDAERDNERGNLKRQRESTGSNYGEEGRRHPKNSPRTSKRNLDVDEDSDVPSQKRRKFLKPSD